MNWLTTLSATAMVLGVLGCGSSNGEPSHGIAPDRQVSALAQEEMYSLCRAAEDRGLRMGDTVDVCTMSALTFTQTFGDCSRYMAACVIDSELEQVERDRIETGCGSDGVAGNNIQEAYGACGLPVEQIDMCVSAKLRADAVRQGVEECADLHEADPESAPPDVPYTTEEVPEACSDVESQCEDVYGLLF